MKYHSTACIVTILFYNWSIKFAEDKTAGDAIKLKLYIQSFRLLDTEKRPHLDCKLSKTWVP